MAGVTVPSQQFEGLSKKCLQASGLVYWLESVGDGLALLRGTHCHPFQSVELRGGGPIIGPMMEHAALTMCTERKMHEVLRHDPTIARLSSKLLAGTS